MTLSSTQAKEEHTRLFLRLNETFSHESSNFKALQRAARPYLLQGTVEQCKDMDALTEKLQQGGFINIGDYTVLKTMIKIAKCDVDEISKFIEDTEKRIKRIEVQHAPKQCINELIGKRERSESQPQHNYVTNHKQAPSQWKNLPNPQNQPSSASLDSSFSTPEPYDCVSQMTRSPSTTMSGELKLIQRELHDRYIDTLSRLHPIPWCEWLELDLDHVYTNLEIMPGRKYQLCPRLNSDFGNIPTLGCLFNKESRNRSVCLIEGPAGIGKSTLCRRLVYLWSNNNYSIDDHSFDLAFLLEAKLLTNLNNCVIEQLFPKDFELSQDSIYQSLRNCQKKCLLIIDGIDELTSKGKTLVMELLNRDKLRNINLLLTGRPEASREYVKYVNTHFRINGFSFKNVKEYICKYFGSNDNMFKDMLLNRLEWDMQLRNIMINPFTTLLVCVLVEDNEGDVPANFSDILNEVLQACCRKYITKVNEGIEKQRKEGSGVASLSKDNLFSAAAHLAYNGIKQGITAYPEDTLASFCPDGLSEHLLKSGILGKDFTVSRLHPKSFCYFPHKSFQEFLCAKHLAALHFEEFKENIFQFPFNDNTFMFLLGMLQCQAKTKVVLERVRVKRHRQSIYVRLRDLERLLNLLHGCDTSEDLLELLVQVISTYDWAITDISFISNYNILKQKNMSAKLKGDFVHHELEKRKSTPFFQMYIRKKLLPPVLLVYNYESDYQRRNSVLIPLMFIEPDCSRVHGTVFNSRTDTFGSGIICTGITIQFGSPRHRKFFITGPSSLRDTDFLDISWSFLHCQSIKDANVILTKDIKMSVLTILLIPGNDSVESITALIKSLTSTKYKGDVLFLIAKDCQDDQHVLRMLSMLSSLQKIAFIKIKCDVKVYRYKYIMTSLIREYVPDCSIIQMYHSKFCPY